MRGFWSLLMAVCLVGGATDAASHGKAKTKRPATPLVEPAPAPGGVNKADPTMPPPLPGGSVKPPSTVAKQADAATPAALTVRFSAPGQRMVIACGRRIRGECLFKGGMTAEQREALKPATAARN